MERWAGKTAVVTGASAGIGADIVVELANAGMVVVAAARRLDKLQELQKHYKGRGRILPCRCDISKADDVQQLIDFAKKNGGVDVLVNNAAFLPTGTVTDVTGKGSSLKDIEECYKINVIGVVNTTRQAVADMMARKVKGHIIIINSIAGHKTVNHFNQMTMTSVYGSSKHAITQLVENIRLELSHTKTPIKITSLSPGAVDTAMLARVPGCDKSAIPMLQGKEVAQAVALVLSTPETVNITELTIQAVGELF